MPVHSRTVKRKASLEALAERVLEAPDLAGLARLLTVALRRALGVPRARRCCSGTAARQLRGARTRRCGRGCSCSRVRGASSSAPRTRFLLSEGQLLETPKDAANETLVPLLARSGLAGMLVLGPLPAAPSRP